MQGEGTKEDGVTWATALTGRPPEVPSGAPGAPVEFGSVDILQEMAMMFSLYFLISRRARSRQNWAGSEGSE